METKGKLRRSALFYLGAIMIATFIVFGLVTYFYPVTELTDDPVLEVMEPDEGVVAVIIYYICEAETNETGYCYFQNQTWYWLHREVRTTYPLRNYAPLSYLFSGTGLVLIVMDRFQRKDQKVIR